MDYAGLAAELMSKMQSLHKARPQKDINEALHGGAFVLHFIALRGGPVLPGEISQEMGVSSARVAAALNNLESKGLITRRIDKNDRRKILAEATQEGTNIARTHYASVQANIIHMLTLLGEDDAKEYVRITGKLADITSAETA